MIKYSISIISHNSGAHLSNLFNDLKKYIPDEAEIILTINTPEDESYLCCSSGLPLTIIRNPLPLGFGENHNRAFSVSRGFRFIILNPDVRIYSPPWNTLDISFNVNIGACAPMVISAVGNIEDNVRYFPTIFNLLMRFLNKKHHPDYAVPADLSSVMVDWAAGMFVMFDSKCYRDVGGFDTRYFMYVEDVDICKRLALKGMKILWVPSCNIVHDAQRESRRNWRYRVWHVRSMVRFLLCL